MAEIYVPIDYSNVKDIIPLGEDVIYSTLSNALYVGDKPWWNWKTHLLITEKGIAFSVPAKKKKDPPQLIYTDLTCITSLLKDGLIVDPSKKYFAMRALFLNVKSDPQFESKEEFLKRKNEFIKKFLPIVLEAKKNLLQTSAEFLSVKERKHQEKQINRMEKFKKKHPNYFY